MSDAFSAGISAGQNYNALMQQQASMYAQIYSHMMLQQQALETQKAQAFYGMQMEIQKSQDQVKLQTLKETGDTYRANLKEQGENQRNYLTQLANIQMKQMDGQSAMELAAFKAQADKDRELAVQGLIGQNNMATTLVTAKSHVLAAQLTNQTNMFDSLLGQMYGPDQAALIVQNANNPLALGYITGGQGSPKARMEMAKAQREMQTSILQWGGMSPDGTFVPGIEQQKLQAMKTTAAAEVAAKSSEGVARLQPMIDQQMALMMKQAQTHGVSNEQFAASIARLNGVADWLAHNNNDPDAMAKATQQIMPLVAQSGVPIPYLQSYVGMRGLLAYNMQQGAGYYSLAFNAMPTQQMMEMHNQQAPDTRSAVEKIATWLGGFVPGSNLTRGVAESGGYATSGATIDVDQTLRSYWADQFKQKNGRAPGTKDAEAFTQQVANMSPSQKILTLQTLVPQTDAGAQLVRQAADQQRTFTDSLSNLVFGDLGKTQDAAHPLEGHYGLTGVAGDIALALVGGKILGWAGTKALPIATAVAGKVLPESVMGFASKAGSALKGATGTQVSDIANIFKNASNAWDANAGALINGGNLLAPADRQALMQAAGLKVNSGAVYPTGNATPEQILGRYIQRGGSAPLGFNPTQLPGINPAAAPGIGLQNLGLRQNLMPNEITPFLESQGINPYANVVSRTGPGAYGADVAGRAVIPLQTEPFNVEALGRSVTGFDADTAGRAIIPDGYQMPTPPMRTITPSPYPLTESPVNLANPLLQGTFSPGVRTGSIPPITQMNPNLNFRYGIPTVQSGTQSVQNFLDLLTGGQ